MEDDKLKDFFAGFEPELSSDHDFMADLERRLDTIEAVRMQMERTKTVNRRALYISSAVAFVAGFLFSTALPAIGRLLLNFVHALPSSEAVGLLADNVMPAALLLAALATAITAITAYDLTLSLTDRTSRP